MITIIAAIDRNRAIGNKGSLLFKIKEDITRFKMLTTGNIIVMGRKTYESLPNGALPYRTNIVISRTRKKIKDCTVFPSIGKFMENCPKDKDIYIIGGEQIYRQTIDIADQLQLTEIDAEAPEADSYFPDFSKWKCIKKERHEGFSFNTYTK